MTYFVFGLGNVGDRYAETRHNAGFLAVDALAARYGLQQRDFSAQRKLQATVARAKRGKDTYVFAKPTTLMNRSGQAVQAVISYYEDVVTVLRASETAQQLVVIHDDLDLPLGRFKLQYATGPKEHNGLTSIYQQVGSDQFWHCRLGIDARDGDRSVPPSNYVLQRFPSRERVTLDETIQRALDAIRDGYETT